MIPRIVTFIHQLIQQTDFWHFQAKDIATLLVALAAFFTAATNLWVAYIWRRRLKCELSNTLRIFYSRRPEHLLRLLVDVVAINNGAKPGVITRMALQITSARDPTDGTLLPWREILTNENIGDKGETRKI